MRTPTFSRTARSLIAAAAALTCLASQAATINIVSRDAPGVGFNDTTPVAPVGGNTGTTLGEQRMNVYRFVANIWEQNLTSAVPITVNAGWEALTCTATSAVLGSAGAWNIWHDFPGSRPGTWYPQALANKIAGVNLSAGTPDDGSGYGNVDIKTQFNVNLGNAGCLTGSTFYLGLDGNAGSNVNFAATLLHELGHGLGFSVISVNTATGQRILADGSAYADNGLPSVWEPFMYDNTTGKTWLNMTSAERKASALNNLKLAWNGPKAVAAASILTGTPTVAATSPAGAIASLDYMLANFGPAMPTTGKLGALATVVTQAGETGPGCDTFDATNRAAVAGKVAIISRGTCGFAVKTKNAQNAGAVAVLIANNVDGPAIALGGTDTTITIPAAGISLADGNRLKAAVVAAKPYGSRSVAGVVTASLALDNTRKAGADTAGRPLLYTPTTLAPGSSVSHWDVSAFPNLLMEPNINSDLTLTVTPPKDITLPLLQDIGW